jgi:hypothetical protein
VSRIERYSHEFVEFIPDNLEAGVLYVSIAYATAAHLCMCGCGFEVTSPLSPQQWRMIFDGQTVSLSPSLGNWSFECASHYWLDRGTVDWAAKWSRARIDSGRSATRLRIERATHETRSTDPGPTTDSEPGWVRRFWAALRR